MTRAGRARSRGARSKGARSRGIVPVLAVLSLVATPGVRAASAPPREDGPAASADSPLAAARARLDAGRLDEARAMLRELIETTPDDRDARLLLAEVHLAADDPQQAVDVLSSIDAPDDWRVAHGLGRALWARADELQAHRGPSEDGAFLLELARKELASAAERAPPNETAPALAAAGIALDAFGDGAAAARLVDVALKRLGETTSPDVAELRLLRGFALSRVYWNARNDSGGRADTDARRAWTRAVEDLTAADAALPRERVDAPWQLAWLQEQEGHADRAVDAALDVLSRAGPDAGAALVFDLADRLAAGEGRDDATAACRALAALIACDRELIPASIRARGDQADAVALRLQWAALEHGGRDTRPALDAIMAAEPRSAAAWNNYGLWLRDHRAYEDSYAAYEHAVSLDDRDPRILNDTAVLLHYYLRRDTDRAIELYERAARLADEALTDSGLDQARRAALREARKDAVNNLRKLTRGDRAAN